VVRVRSRAGQELRATLVARERLVRIQREPVDQIRGLPKPAGLVPPRTTPGRLVARAAELLDQAPGPRPAVPPLAAARAAIARESAGLDRAPVRRAAADAACRRLTTIPGVGAVTATGLMAAVDDPGASSGPTGSRPASA
jgi:transposase